MKEILRGLVPPLVVHTYQQMRRAGIRFTGPYPDWREAVDDSQGYAADVILDRVAKATRQVVAGEAAFERDGVAFTDPLPNFPLLSALLDAAVRNAGRLKVLDFGGALGGTYSQARPFLHSLSVLHWCVVEQPHYVDRGRREFAGSELSFAESIDQCCAGGCPDIAVFSGVLQYLKSPRSMVQQAVAAGIARLVFDRTPTLVGRQASRIFVQRNPAALGGDSYPLWLFSKADLTALPGPSYRLSWESAALEGRLGSGPSAADFCTLYFEREGS